jgi:hypothetical protein
MRNRLAVLASIVVALGLATAGPTAAEQSKGSGKGPAHPPGLVDNENLKDWKLERGKGGRKSGVTADDDWEARGKKGGAKGGAK